MTGSNSGRLSTPGSRLTSATRKVDMGRALLVMLLPILLAACGGSSAPNEAEANRNGRCLYAVEGMEYGRMLQWGSCSNPPPYAISRISD